MKYLKLLRFPNLLIIAFTQYLVRYSLIIAFDIEHALTDLEFFFLVLSTMLIAGAGNTINDYFDVKVDRLNKADQVIVGDRVSRKSAIAIHLSLSLIGILIAAYLSWTLKIYWFVLIHIAAAASLYFYSTHFKKQFVVGNILVSLLTATVVLLVALYELVPVPGPVFEGESSSILQIIIAYASFSFVISWIREIVKDIEDYAGDKEVGYNTMAINWGVKGAKSFVQALSFLMLLAVLFVSLSQFSESRFALIYVLVLVALPTLMFIARMSKATEAEQFGKAASLAKFIMLTGAGSMLYFAVLSLNGLL